MSSKKSIDKISRFLSYILRHKPDDIDLEVDEHGWADVEELITKTNSSEKFPNMKLTMELLKETVATDAKQRFSFDEAGTKIRANQGHSVKVDLGLENQVPPDILYHGTTQTNLESIFRDGLHAGERHAVHLSKDKETAKVVGSRRGAPVVLIIDAKAMHEAGLTFQCSDNGVWLTESVPAMYIIQ
jgi:putative RNA 2'-phosphotransferase